MHRPSLIADSHAGMRSAARQWPGARKRGLLARTALPWLLLSCWLCTAHVRAQPRLDVNTDAAVLAPSQAQADAGALEPRTPSASVVVDGGAEAPRLTPPRVRASVPPVYPVSHLAHNEHPTVVLKVTILPDGSVADVMVEHTAGPDFDQAAIDAVRQWSFEPARRGDQPIASRIGIAVHFDLPELGALDVASVQAASAPVPHRHHEGDPHADDEPSEHRLGDPGGPFGALAEVEGRDRSEQRGNSDFRLDRALLEAAPHADAAELLKGAPGLVVARIEGEAVGHRLMLRGFDADHGQDIELSVDGVPVNQPSHIHGQGYADLSFIVPETVRSLRVIEGVYDPAQGDFAVAGSAEYQLGVERRGIQLASSYGAFQSFRELALWAPEGESPETFAAFSARKTAGFGQNRQALAGTAVAQGLLKHGRMRLLLHGSAHASRAHTANVLRRDDIDAGKVDFYDVYPLPTAQAQHASGVRAQLSGKLRYRGARGESGELTLYALFHDFRMLANYTGFTERSRENPEWLGRGDLIEQQNEMRTLGLRARYKGARFTAREDLFGTLELGLSARVDQISQAQNLLDAPENTTWDRRIDAALTAADVGAYLDLDLTLSRFVHVKGGARVDVLAYRVGDALQNRAPSFRREDYIPGYRRSAAGLAAGPRVVLELLPWSTLVLSAAYGEGYRSPQALLLDEGEPAPFTKVRSTDLGLRYELGRVLSLRASGFYTHLQEDVVFEPAEGRVEAVGPSVRRGAVLYAEARPLAWLRGAASLTYVEATLEEPPPRTDEDPSPPFERGQALAYVPPWVVRVDASAERPLLALEGAALDGKLGLGLTHWSKRPLPYGEFTAPVTLLDATVGLRWRSLSLECALLNLLDSRYSALELSAASSWDPGAVPSRLPMRHVIAGAPRTWLLTLGVRL